MAEFGAQDAAVLATVEALRHYFAAHSQSGEDRLSLALQWRAGQLLPPDDGEFQCAVALMSKSRGL